MELMTILKVLLLVLEKAVDYNFGYDGKMLLLKKEDAGSTGGYA